MLFKAVVKQHIFVERQIDLRGSVIPSESYKQLRFPANANVAVRVGSSSALNVDTFGLQSAQEQVFCTVCRCNQFIPVISA